MRYNKGHLHEAMHVAFILCEMLDQYIMQTPSCEKFPEAKAAAEAAHEALFELYQVLGTKM